jgi:hypothetical protein
MNKVYILAHTWQDTDMTIIHAFSNEKAIKMFYDLVGDYDGEHPNPDPEEEFLTAVEEYKDWCDEHDEYPDYCVTAEIIET